MKHRNKEQWLALVIEHQASGLSAAQFCRVKKLNANTFSLRKRQLQGRSKSSAAFMPVVASPASPLRVMSSPARFAPQDSAVSGGMRLLVGPCALQFDSLPEARWLVSVVRGLA